MKTIARGVIGIVAALCVVLTGCNTPPQPRTGAADVLLESCRALELPKPGFTFKLGGLEIPFKPQNPFKIGTIEFNKEDGQRVSNEIYAIAELRRKQCSVISAALLGTPPPTGAQILAMQDGMDKVKNQSDSLVALFNTPGATPKEAINKANEAKAAADAEATKARNLALPIQKVGIENLSEELATEFSELRRIKIIQAQVNEMQRQLDEIKNLAKFRQISITGFEPRGIALTAPMKEELTANFDAILRSAKASSAPRVAIIGYADSTGVYLRNVDIGLQRAKSVASYLGRAFPQRAEITTISSGGVRLNDTHARRVDVLIS